MMRLALTVCGASLIVSMEVQLMRQQMQQRVLSLALCFASIGSALVPGRAQVIDETLKQKIELDTEHTAPDDALLSMARSAKLNVIADATQFKGIDATAPIGWTAYKQSGRLGSYLLELSDGRGLSWTHPDARSFLVWKQPDVASLAKRIVAGEGVQLPVAPIEAKEWQAMWLKYLQATAEKSEPKAAETAPAGDLAKPILILQVKDLPLRLRLPVTSMIQAHLLASPLATYDKRSLSDEFWSSAAVGLRPRGGGEPGGPAPESLVLITWTKNGTVDFNSIDPMVMPKK